MNWSWKLCRISTMSRLIGKNATSIPGWLSVSEMRWETAVPPGVKGSIFWKVVQITYCFSC